MRKIDSKECHKNFGKYIQERRESLKIPQHIIAERAGICQSYLSRVERGERNLDFVLALNLCEALDLDIKEFIESYL